jgi:hypothetical protein
VKSNDNLRFLPEKRVVYGRRLPDLVDFENKLLGKLWGGVVPTIFIESYVIGEYPHN